MSDEVKKKLDELANVVTAIQTKNDSFEKKYDGLITAEIKSLEEKASSIAASVESMTLEKKAQQEKIDQLEKIVARGGNGQGGQKTDLDIYNESLLGWMRNGKQIDPEIAKKGLVSYFSAPGLSQQEVEMKTMQVGINPEGGYWVMPERLAKTIGRDFETSPIRRLASVINTTSDSVEMIIDDNESTQGGWTNETSSRTQTSEPKIGLLTIQAHELYTLHKTTQKLLDDAGFDVGAWLLEKINSKQGRIQNTAFMVGNGAGKPKGIFGYSAWSVAGTYQREAIEQINSGAATTLTADGLISLQNALHETYQMNAEWMMKRQTWGAIIKLKASTSGEYLIDPAILRNGAGQLVLLGNPVNFASDCADIGASALPIAYGDFGMGYTIVDKVGVNTIRDNITDKGRVIFYVSRRTGGAVTNYEAIKIQKVSA